MSKLILANDGIDAVGKSLLEKAGFINEGILYSYRVFKGKQVDIVMLGLPSDKYFNNIDSKITENGGILIFGLSPSDKSETILHEAFHGIDFIYKKGKFSKKLPHFTISTSFKLPSVWSPKYRFGTLLYLLNDEEVKAHLNGAYEEGKKFYQTLEGTKE